MRHNTQVNSHGCAILYKDEESVSSQLYYHMLRKSSQQRKELRHLIKRAHNLITTQIARVQCLAARPPVATLPSPTTLGAQVCCSRSPSSLHHSHTQQTLHKHITPALLELYSPPRSSLTILSQARGGLSTAFLKLKRTRGKSWHRHTIAPISEPGLSRTLNSATY